MELDGIYELYKIRVSSKNGMFFHWILFILLNQPV